MLFPSNFPQQSNKLLCTFLIFIGLNTFKLSAQVNFSQSDSVVLDIVANFGANPNDTLDDTWAFIKASKYISNQWDMNGIPYTNAQIQSNSALNINYTSAHVILKIPAGKTPDSVYKVGLQQNLYLDSLNGHSYYYSSCNGNAYSSIPFQDIYTPANSSSYPNSLNMEQYKIPNIYQIVDSNILPLNTLTLYNYTYANGNSNYPMTATAYTVSGSYCAPPTTINKQLYDINQSPTTVITVPSYKYKVTSPYTVSTPIFTINNSEITNNKVNGIEIRGIPNNANSVLQPIIRYGKAIVGFTNGEGKYYINNANQPQMLPYSAGFARQESMFYLYDIENVKIQNIEIDGNLGNDDYRGYGTDGYQIGSIGIRLATRNTTLKDIYVHHMQLDGIYLQNNQCQLDANIYGENIVSEYNQRQGLTYATGRNVIVKHSKFNHNGYTPNPNIAGEFLGSRPMAGMDIEYGFECTNNNATKYVMYNARFDSCEFNFNRGPNVINDIVEPHIRNKDIQFNGCTFHKLKTSSPAANDFYGIFVFGEKIRFNNCHIYCPVVGAYVNDSINGETQFIGCDFEDKPYNGVHWDNAWLVETNGAKKTLFQNCAFKVNDKNRELLYFNGDAIYNNWPVFDNCNFIYANDGKPTTNSSQVTRVKFRNKNTLINTLNTTNSYHSLTMNNISFEGSTNACNPSEFSIGGQIQLVLGDAVVGNSPSGTNDAYATITVKDKAYVYEDEKYVPTLYYYKTSVGKNARIVIEPGGSYASLQELYLKGKLIAQKNSFIELSKGFIDSFGTSSLLYIDKDANKNLTSMNPIWCNGIGYGTSASYNTYNSNWMLAMHNTLSPTICVHGNQSQIVANTSITKCTPTYNNVANGKTFTLMYNHTASCVGLSANISMNVAVQGGTPPYNYSIDGASFTNSNTFTSLLSGVHTLVVTDASCADTFALNLEPDIVFKIIKGCINTTNAEANINSCTAPAVQGPNTASISYNTTTALYEIGFPTVGTYTITATTGTLPYTTTVYIGSCSTCTQAPSSAQWFVPSGNTSVSLPSGVTPNTPLVFDGAINVDADLYIYNNPNVFFAANSLVTIDTNSTLVCNKSTLRGCGTYWQGITANGKNRALIVNNYSHIQNMSSGIVISNNAFLNATSSFFKNNATSCITLNNHSLVNNNIVMYSNYFMSDAGFIPYGTNLKGLNGITAKNVGSLAIKNNTFTNLYNGITLTADAGISSILPGNTNNIEVLNNRFEDILADNTNFGTDGSAVYIDYSPASTFNAHTSISNTGSMTTIANFKNCDVGINSTNSHLIDTMLYMLDCKNGIINNSLFTTQANISNNKIENTALGIQLNGNFNHYAITNNQVTTDGGTPMFTLANMFVIPPVAVDVKHFSNLPQAGDTFLLDNNTIAMGSTAGKAIQLLNGNSNNSITNNSISNAGTALLPYSTDHGLYGLFVSNSDGTRIMGNVVDGNNNANVYTNSYSKGFYFEQSPNCYIQCNKARYTKQGLYAWGNNTTADTNIRFNKFKYNRNPLYLLDQGNALPGTFGNIGTAAVDNGNEWLYNTTDASWLQSGLFKVWRNSSVPINDEIRTSPSLLTLLESGSSTGGINSYPVATTSGIYMDICPAPAFKTTPGTSGNGWTVATADDELAVAIALDSLNFIAFETSAGYMTDQHLYNLLDRDIELRNSSPILLNFYNSFSNTSIAQAQNAGNILNQLIHYANQTNFTYLYNQATTATQAMASGEVWEQNEQAVNQIALGLLYGGKQNISPTQLLELDIIAKMCPYVGGNAVYTARSLNAIYKPHQHYNDRVKCISATNANAKTTEPFNENINIDSFYEAQTNVSANALATEIRNNLSYSIKPLVENMVQNILVYPNPANDIINIKYSKNNDGNLYLFDALGKLILETKLTKGNKNVIIPISSINTGIYSYKIVFDDVIKIGKINIE